MEWMRRYIEMMVEYGKEHWLYKSIKVQISKLEESESLVEKGTRRLSEWQGKQGGE